MLPTLLIIQNVDLLNGIAILAILVAVFQSIMKSDTIYYTYLHIDELVRFQLCYYTDIQSMRYKAILLTQNEL